MFFERHFADEISRFFFLSTSEAEMESRKCGVSNLAHHQDQSNTVKAIRHVYGDQDDKKTKNDEKEMRRERAPRGMENTTHQFLTYISDRRELREPEGDHKKTKYHNK